MTRSRIGYLEILKLGVVLNNRSRQAQLISMSLINYELYHLNLPFRLRKSCLIHVSWHPVVRSLVEIHGARE